MQDEEMDDIIRDAAKQHYPTYDDKAWGKMERALDKHLPQKKSKRKYLLFLLLFLLIDAGIFFAIMHSKQNDPFKPATVSQNSSQANTNLSSPVKNLQHNNIVVNNDEKTNQSITALPTESKINTVVSIKGKNFVVANLSTTHNKITFRKRSKFSSQSGVADISDNDAIQNDNKQTSPEKDNVVTNLPSVKSLDEKTSANDVINPTKNNTTKTTFINTPDTINKNVASEKAASSAIVSASNKKDKNTFANNFAFTLSAGPGFSYVDLNYFGKPTFSYGAGVSYTIAKRFVLRTGFYVSSKIYSAAPGDYHPPKWFYTDYPDLQKVDANCKVYEIPLSISYEFAQRKKHNWFVATGLSSYLMKKESYGYTYEDPAGQKQYATAEVDNKNKNIFSIMALSGGYRYNINNKVSVMAEPYLELPFDGIGFGKINLNSSGLLFTVAIKPFARKN
jgi:hypothetical protein